MPVSSTVRDHVANTINIVRLAATTRAAAEEEALHAGWAPLSLHGISAYYRGSRVGQLRTCVSNSQWVLLTCEAALPKEET